MRDDFLPFSKPSISEDDIKAVGDVIRSLWLATGPKSAEFESAFKQYTSARNAVALSSGTAGMHILFKALNIGPGDEVITPSMTWVSTVNLITLSGATVVFADVNADTLMLEADEAEKLITERTRAIIPVHYAGAACDMDRFNALGRKYDVHIIQDAAHAVGTKYKNSMVGSSGTAVFSFHPIKNITTGEGGMFITDNDSLAERIKRLKFHGLGVDAFDRKTQGRAPKAEVVEPGYKYNLTDIAAVLGTRQLARLDEFNAKRELLANYYLEQLAKIDEVEPLGLPEYDFKHAWHLFIVRVVSEKISREQFMAELKKRNIGTGLHFLAAHTHKYYRETMPHNIGRLPASEWNSQRICSLPLFPDMETSDVDDVVNAIKEIFANV